MHQVGEHSGFAPVAATRIKTDAINLNSPKFVALYFLITLTSKTNDLLLVVKFRISVYVL